MIDIMGDKIAMQMANRVTTVATLRRGVTELKELLDPETDYYADAVLAIEEQVDMLERDNADILGDYKIDFSNQSVQSVRIDY